MDTSRYRVTAGKSVDLHAWDPHENGGLDRNDADDETKALTKKLESIQERIDRSEKNWKFS